MNGRARIKVVLYAAWVMLLAGAAGTAFCLDGDGLSEAPRRVVIAFGGLGSLPLAARLLRRYCEAWTLWRMRRIKWH